PAGAVPAVNNHDAIVRQGPASDAPTPPPGTVLLPPSPPAGQPSDSTPRTPPAPPKAHEEVEEPGGRHETPSGEASE
ncbi:MAG TPA: hypothetical protein VN108_02795, partial [Marmoricola sp.]|nr:hypothetical protein [Marmoricola sp.]